VVVFGCGGVGLSAVMIATAAGARVVAVDIAPAALDLARRHGAAVCVEAGAGGPAATAVAVRDATGGGAHLTIDAIGSHDTLAAAVESLRRRGRHVQVGLLPPAGGRPAVPMDLVISRELAIYGSHGLPAHAYPRLLSLVTSGVLPPDLLPTQTIGLADLPAALSTMDQPRFGGIRLVDPR
jgi:alcohol dehydrogenase